MASTPAKHRYGADHAPERRTPLGHKRINQSASAATSLSYLLQDLQLKDEATPSRKLLSDKGSNKHDPARRQSPERRGKRFISKPKTRRKMLIPSQRRMNTPGAVYTISSIPRSISPIQKTLQPTGTQPKFRSSTFILDESSQLGTPSMTNA